MGTLIAWEQSTPCDHRWLLISDEVLLLAWHQSHREFSFWSWQIPGPLLEKSRKFPFRTNDLFTSKHVHHC